MGMTGWQIIDDLNSTKSHGDKLIYSIGVVYIIRGLLELGIGGGELYMLWNNYTNCNSVIG